MNSREKLWLGFCLLFIVGGTISLTVAYSSWHSTYQLLQQDAPVQAAHVQLPATLGIGGAVLCLIGYASLIDFIVTILRRSRF